MLEYMPVPVSVIGMHAWHSDLADADNSGQALEQAGIHLQL